jgi:hypothetical protein
MEAVMRVDARIRWWVVAIVIGACGGGGGTNMDPDGGSRDGGADLDGEVPDAGGALSMVVDTVELVRNVRIAVAADGSPRIAYIARKQGVLNVFYAAPNNGAWAVEALPVPPTALDTTPRLELVVDSTGVAQALYTDAGEQLQYARRVNGTWTGGTIAGREPYALALGPANSVHVVFKHMTLNETHYGLWNGASFATELMATSNNVNVPRIDLAVGANGVAHVSGNVFSPNSYVFGTAGAFTAEPISFTSPTSVHAVVVESGGQVDLVAAQTLPAGNEDVIRLRRDAGTWMQTQIAPTSGGVDRTPAAIDGSDAVHAAAIVATGVGFAMEYYRPSGGSYTLIPVTPSVSNQLGDLAVASDGTAHIAFARSGAGMLQIQYVRP